MFGRLSSRRTLFCKEARSCCCRSYAASSEAQQEEWWVVDGEMFKREEFDGHKVLEPESHSALSNARRRKMRTKEHLQTRLKFRDKGQTLYWQAYMRRFQILRDQWEKLIWDPKVVPLPKPRKSSWVKEETERYIWKDPRRELYKARMEAVLTSARAEQELAMNFGRVENKKDAGAVRSSHDEEHAKGHAVESTMQDDVAELWYDLDDDSKDEDASESEDESEEYESESEAWNDKKGYQEKRKYQDGRQNVEHKTAKHYEDDLFEDDG